MNIATIVFLLCIEVCYQISVWKQLPLLFMSFFFMLTAPGTSLSLLGLTAVGVLLTGMLGGWTIASLILCLYGAGLATQKLGQFVHFSLPLRLVYSLMLFSLIHLLVKGKMPLEWTTPLISAIVILIIVLLNKRMVGR